MAIEPPVVPEQLALPAFKVIGRAPVLLARFGNMDQTEPRALSPENMDVDTGPAHSPLVESNTTPVLLSRINVGRVAALGSSSEASAPTSVSNASSQAGVIESVPSPSTPLNPIVARPVSAQAPDLSTLSSASPGLSKGKTKAIVNDVGGSTATTSQPSPSASGSSTESQSSALPGKSTASTPSSSNRDPALTLEKILSKRSDSLGVAHTKLSTNMTQWVEHEERTMASGGTLHEHLKELRAESDVSVAQATRAREEAERAEELAIRQRERSQQALSQLEGLQTEHTRGRDLAAEAQQYSEKLQKWDATAKEKEQRFVGALRNHRQTEETARARQADEVARHEVARAEAEAARAKEEVENAREREELVAARADLDASRKNEVALRREVASLQRKLKAVVETIAGLAGTSEDEGEAQATIKESAPLPVLDRQIPLSPSAAHSSAAIGVPQVSSSASLREARLESPPHTTRSTPPASATAGPTRDLDTEATPSRKSSSHSPSRPVVSGFVPAQTEAGRTIDTERPLASTSLTSELRSGTVEARASATANKTPSRDSSATGSSGPEGIVKQEPDLDVVMLPVSPPGVTPKAYVSRRPQVQTTSVNASTAEKPASVKPVTASLAHSTSSSSGQEHSTSEVAIPLRSASSQTLSTSSTSRRTSGPDSPSFPGNWQSTFGGRSDSTTPTGGAWDTTDPVGGTKDVPRPLSAAGWPGSSLSGGVWSDSPPGDVARQGYVVPQDWLLDPAFLEARKGLRVRIQFTRGDEHGYLEWSAGEYEGKEARVLDVTAHNWSGATATVLIEKACQLEVPVRYLRPIQPRKLHMTALLLNGKYKGTIGSQRDHGGGFGLFKIGHILHEVAHERLCIWEDPDTNFDPYREASVFRTAQRVDHGTVGVLPAGTKSSARPRRPSDSVASPQAGHYQQESISSSTPSVPAKRVFQEEGQEQQEWNARRPCVGANAGYSLPASLPANSPTAAGGSPIKRTRVRIDQARHLSGSSSATQSMHDPNSRPLETARKRKDTNQHIAEFTGQSPRTASSSQPSTSAHVRHPTSGDRRVEDPSLLARINVAKPNVHVSSDGGDLSQEHRPPPTTIPRKAARLESSQHPNASREPLLRTADEGKIRRQGDNSTPGRGGATGRGGAARGGKNAGARGRGGTAAVGVGRGSRGRGRGRGGHRSTSPSGGVGGHSLLDRITSTT